MCGLVFWKKEFFFLIIQVYILPCKGSEMRAENQTWDDVCTSDAVLVGNDRVFVFALYSKPEGGCAADLSVAPGVIFEFGAFEAFNDFDGFNVYGYSVPGGKNDVWVSHVAAEWASSYEALSSIHYYQVRMHD
jgi:hypothetical protein